LGELNIRKAIKKISKIRSQVSRIPKFSYYLNSNQQHNFVSVNLSKLKKIRLKINIDITPHYR